ncbi:MAG: M13 family metallopeptidase [Alphaproteobacteria bacterium]|nr:M13 family metallopeptidase [Alphaproteobacteria bacterium]
MIDVKNFNPAINPGDDFYEFATAGWRANNPMRSEFAIYGQFHKLIDENQEKIKNLILELSAGTNAPGSDAAKIGDLYNLATDEKRLNAEGATPLAADLAAIDSIAEKSQIPTALATLHNYASAFFSWGVEPDMKDSTTNMLWITQGGLGLPNKEYYFDTGDKSDEIRAKYQAYIARALRLFDIAADAAAEKIYALESDLASSFYEKEKLRDPVANYHKFTREELNKQFAGFDWNAYFAARNIAPKNVLVGQPEAITKAIEIINSYALDDIKLYLKFRLIEAASSKLSDEIYENFFDFHARTLSGTPEAKPRWKRAVMTVCSSLVDPVGKAYVAKFFPPAAKKRMQGLVDRLNVAFKSRIEKLDWLCAATKQKAYEKLASFRFKIGYPDKWRDYSKLSIVPAKSYWENIKSVADADARYFEAQIDSPVDKELWWAAPHEVNAYFHPLMNEICFPAGILQPPFFDLDADDASNYGAIGSVIAHEMTHGFDDEGRKFDANANLNDWWSDEDSKNFETRAKVMEDFFNAIEVAPGLYANGKFTLGENIADYGGMAIAFEAFKNLPSAAPDKTVDGYTPAQRFFLAYASTEAGHIRDEEVVRRTKVDPHSLCRWRVNAILPHIDAWYYAFGIKDGDKLYLAPEKRVKIW